MLEKKQNIRELGILSPQESAEKSALSPAPEVQPGHIEVLINASPGGFELSRKALLKLYALCPQHFDGPYEAPARGSLLWPLAVVKEGGAYYLDTLSPEVRKDPAVISVWRELGKAALGSSCSRLKTVQVPQEIQWAIVEDDSGVESVHEVHRIWS